ncbi:tetratricopeptide repeat protein, partial [candidate division KSB1 bacterium]|nr:tetratricopeptide repeat protein [candidate division KSB1 bacterium]
NKIRLQLIRELMKEREYEQAAAHAEIYEQKLRAGDSPQFIDSLQDSLYRLLTKKYSDKFEQDPSDRETMEKLSVYHNNLGQFEQSIKVMETYFKQVPIESDPQMAFRYAQHCAWYGKPEKAEYVLKMLLENESGNLDYQLLMGQVLVWQGKDLDESQKYLENVHNQTPRNIYAILTLASLNIARQNLETAHEYLELAKSLDPTNKEIAAVERYYQSELKAERERKVFQILEQGRELVQEGKYEQALGKYEAYFARVIQPKRPVRVEFAELNISAKNLDRAISIFSDLLAEEYSFEIALKRAKTLLWNGNADSALTEFESLLQKRPDHFESRLFLGDAYLNLKRFKKARTIYTELLNEDLSSEQAEMVQSRFQYLPQTGLGKMLSKIPNHLGFNPMANFYSDNQNFQIYHLGGTGQAGMGSFLTLGASFVNANVASADRQRDFKTFKGRLIIRPQQNFSISGGFGTLNSRGEIKRSVKDVSISFSMNDELNAAFYYENNDAALILYSPYLVDRRFDVDFYKFTGSYQSQSKIMLSGYFNFISISDGNRGNDVQLRIGKEFFSKTVLGYESQYLNYKYLAPFVPGSNGSQTLYYSPQNLDSHSLWLEYKPWLAESMKINFGAKLGYLPELDIILRQIEGRIQFQPTKYLTVNGKISAGSSYRFDSSYNYFSCSVSSYWSIY